MFSRIHGWILFTADVSTAFLQGKRSDRGISVLLPAEACRMLGYAPGTRMKLLKSMYGLSDAPRLWWEEATDRMVSCGFVIHPLDPCLFLSYRVESNDMVVFDGAIGLHVDDMLGGGSNKEGQTCFATRVKAVSYTHLTLPTKVTE